MAFRVSVPQVADLSDPGPSPAEYDDAMSLLKGEKDTGGRPFFPTLTARKSTKIQDKTSMEMESALALFFSREFSAVANLRAGGGCTDESGKL